VNVVAAPQLGACDGVPKARRLALGLTLTLLRS